MCSLDRYCSEFIKNGKTVHTTFKLPLNITESTTCNVKHNSNNGTKFEEIQIIIWNEISMTSKFAFEAVDRLLQDICNVQEIFGGKTVLVSGDFMQILPVFRHGLNEGLFNGTRLSVKKLLKYSIEAQIIIEKLVLIPRICLSPSNEEIPFNMRRKQFPIHT